MKKLFFTLAAIAVTSWAVAQNKGEDLIAFKAKTHNFGKIKQGVPVTYDFIFENISDKPVVVENANATCGCTTPEWPKQPIGKGKSGTIKAGFNAAALGTFDRSIYVKLVGAEIPVEIKITGEVLNAEAFTQYEASKKAGKGK